MTMMAIPGRTPWPLPFSVFLSPILLENDLRHTTVTPHAARLIYAGTAPSESRGQIVKIKLEENFHARSTTTYHDPPSPPTFKAGRAGSSGMAARLQVVRRVKITSVKALLEARPEVRLAAGDGTGDNTKRSGFLG